MRTRYSMAASPASSLSRLRMAPMIISSPSAAPRLNRFLREEMRISARRSGMVRMGLRMGAEVRKMIEAHLFVCRKALLRNYLCTGVCVCAYSGMRGGLMIADAERRRG